MARELVHLVGGKQAPGRSGRFDGAFGPCPSGMTEGAGVVIPAVA
jgi:hypothetical protein